VLIRLAQTSDLAALMALVRRVVPLMRAAGNLQWNDDYPNEEVFARDIERAQLWVAEQAEGVVAGVAAITTAQSPEYAQVGWDIEEPAIVVHRLAVDPAFRGAGIAGALMQQAEAVGRERRISVLRVDTNTENAATQRLFPKLGYTLAGEISLNFRPGLRFLCYEKRLPIKRVAAIALGSNLASTWGDREDNLREAVKRVAVLGEVRAVSSFYDTAPVGYTAQPRFRNAAMVLETELEPLQLMRALLEIERVMGRADRSIAIKKGPRMIDLDLLLMGDVVLAIPELTLPHPAMAERRFVLEPLAEIAPTMVHPESGRTIAELLAELPAT
jgi:2-amino-4-hydroxy-6-hydroxymethyldihydropteridine diphosphokinase